MSEWYQDKVIPFHEASKIIYSKVNNSIEGVVKSKYFYPGTHMPAEILVNGEIYKYTPFGYVHEKYASIPANNGLYKDVLRGLIPLGQASSALWKTDLFNLRYIYFRRSKLTKANPELREGMEQLADQIEQNVPVFGPYFRKQLTDSGVWEHVNKVKTVSADEFREFMKWKTTSQSIED